MTESEGGTHKPDAHRAAAPAEAPPRWMKRGTIWMIMVLATGALALVAYYLLPLWWAGTIAGWVAGSNTWVTGILLGFVLLLVAAYGGIIALRITDGDGTVGGVMRARKAAKSSRKAADKIATRHGLTVEEPSGGWRHYARLAFTILTGASMAALLLTVSIGIGFAEPLREARALWRDDSPGVLSATLIGVLLGVLVIFGLANLRQRRRMSKLTAAAKASPPRTPRVPDSDPVPPTPVDD